MMVKSDGMSTYSAITFTPPSDMSVIVQSRGNEPVPNWILANRLQRRRSLVRRFASISILRLARGWLTRHSPLATLQKNHWDLPIAISRNLSVVFEMFLPNSSGSPKILKNWRKTIMPNVRGSNFAALPRGYYTSRMGNAMSRKQTSFEPGEQDAYFAEGSNKRWVAFTCAKAMDQLVGDTLKDSTKSTPAAFS